MVDTTQVTFANQTPLRIGAVTLAVRDLDRVAAFYHEVLGLAQLARDDGRVVLGIDGVRLVELERHPDASPDDQRAAGLFHTAFLMPERTELARWLRHFSALGLPLDGASDHLVSEAIYISDPEGNGIEIYADRPRESWRWSDSGLEMGTYPLDQANLLDSAGDAPYRAAPEALRIGHIHLRVGDLAKAEAFYSGLLGMSVTTRVPGATFLASGGYHHHVGANIWRSRGAGTRDLSRTGLVRFEIEAAAEAFSGLREQLGEAAVPFEEHEHGIALLDPWGTGLTLTRAA